MNADEMFEKRGFRKGFIIHADTREILSETFTKYTGDVQWSEDKLIIEFKYSRKSMFIKCTDFAGAEIDMKDLQVAVQKSKELGWLNE